MSCNLPARIWPRRSSGAQNALRDGDAGGVGNIVCREEGVEVLVGPVKASRTGYQALRKMEWAVENQKVPNRSGTVLFYL